MRPRSVLIVDDSLLIRKTLCEAFTREGEFEICGEAENGRDAIEKARLLHPDLIVMDLSMPRLNGLEATRTLKRMMRTTPVILYSIYDVAAIRREAILAGADAVISKSESPAVLIEKARELVGRAAA